VYEQNFIYKIVIEIKRKRKTEICSKNSMLNVEENGGKRKAVRDQTIEEKRSFPVR